jgi:hypothetical protein
MRKRAGNAWRGRSLCVGARFGKGMPHSVIDAYAIIERLRPAG